MKLETIIKLVDAGYTKEQIEALEVTEPEPEPAKAPEDKVPEPAKAPEDKVPEPAEAPENALIEALESLNSKIKELDSNIKKANILGSSVTLPKEQSAEDILASIITPKPKNKK